MRYVSLLLFLASMAQATSVYHAYHTSHYSVLRTPDGEALVCGPIATQPVTDPITPVPPVYIPPRITYTENKSEAIITSPIPVPYEPALDADAQADATQKPVLLP